MRINANGGLKITEKKLVCQMQVVPHEIEYTLTFKSATAVEAAQ